MCSKLLAVDIFSGAGGMSIGAKLAGIKTTLAIEIDQSAAATYAKNHPSTIVLQQDIRSVNPLEHVNVSPFVLFGGPPCQGFSVSNRRTRNINNPNNWMYKEYLRFVNELKPSWFVFENVEGFKHFEKGSFAHTVEQHLKDSGYETNATILNATDAGVPQKRSRYFIVGHRLDEGGLKFDFSAMPKKEIVAVSDAISDLPSMENGEKSEIKQYKTPAISAYSKLMRGSCEYATQNLISVNQPHIIERYKVIKQGENWRAAKERGYLDSYSSTKNTHSGIYRRLLANEPAVTIANYRKSMLIHPFEHRGLSLREAARLQSFPDNYTFEGTLNSKQQQVGNAVPPLLAKAVFEEIIRLNLKLEK